MNDKENSLLIAVLKQLCDISLYISCSGVIFAFMKATTPLYLPVLVILAAFSCSYLLRKIKLIRLLPLAASIALQMLLHKRGLSIHLAWITPIYIYEFIVVIKGAYYTNHKSFASIYSVLIWISALIGVMGSGLSSNYGSDNGSCTFTIVYIVAGMLLLKYTRQRVSVTKESYFNGIIIKTEALIALCVTVLCCIAFFGYKGARALIVYLLSLVPTRPFNLSPREPKDSRLLPNFEYVMDSSRTHEIVYWHKKNVSAITIGVFAVAFIIFVIVFLAIKLNGKKKLYNFGKDAATESISLIGRKKHVQLKGKGNRIAVRRCYRKFMQLCKKHKIQFSESSTARQVCNGAKEMGFSSEECDALWQIYILARYSGSDITDEQAQRANSLYKRIKQSK